MAEAKKKPSHKTEVKSYNAGQMIFNENDVADSLYIIQTGQIRLFRPKGRGFIELSIVRAGEVIGEMAYFEKNKHRNCSAQAIISTEIIEIPYHIFGKAFANLNPWIRTVMQTLVDRLQASNEKTKSLESSSVGLDHHGRVGNYVFFHNKEVVKILATMYLVIKSYGKQGESCWEIDLNRLTFFMFDIYNIPDIKREEFLQLLNKENFISIEESSNHSPTIVTIEEPEFLREVMVFVNTQRILEDHKKIKISPKCELFLSKILEQLEEEEVTRTKCKANLTNILEDFKTRNIIIGEDDLRDAIDAKLVESVLVGDNKKLTSIINYKKLKELFPCIRLMNAIRRTNEIKSGTRN